MSYAHDVYMAALTCRSERLAHDAEMFREDAEDSLHNEATKQLANNKDAFWDFLVEVAQDWFALPDCGEEKFDAHPFMRFAFGERRDVARDMQIVLEARAIDLHIESSFIEGEF